MVEMTTFTTDDRLHAEQDGSLTIDCRLKPLENLTIHTIAVMMEFGGNYEKLLKFARAIEKAHGIG